MKRPTFAQLMDEIKAEAKAEGPDAIAQLERLQHRYALGAQILSLRLKSGLTQKDLAKKTGIDQGEISKIERGVGNPTEDTLAILGRPFHVKLAYVPEQKALHA